MVVPANAKYQIIHEMLQCDDNMLNVTWLCDAAGVSRSGYYHYLELVILGFSEKNKTAKIF